MNRLLIAVLVAGFLLGGCSPGPSVQKLDFGPADQACDPASIIQLIANPDSFDGRKVRVLGVLRWEFEGNSLYLSKDAHDHWMMHDAVWVDLDPAKVGAREDEIQKLSGRHVLMEGVFDKSSNGHGGFYSGMIRSITRISDWQH